MISKTPDRRFQRTGISTRCCFLGISTSDNSKNVMSATVVARVLRMKVIELTGAKGRELAEVVEVAVEVPEIET